MKVTLALISVMTFPALLAILAAPAWLIGWLKDRRESAIRRQVALAEAVEREFGPIGSPEITNPLRGPSRIRIALPFAQPAAAARVLSMVGRILSMADRLFCGRYEVVLVPGPMLPPPEARASLAAPRGREVGEGATAGCAPIGWVAGSGSESPA
jgi:hypothetical protein